MITRGEPRKPILRIRDIAVPEQAEQENMLDVFENLISDEDRERLEDAFEAAVMNAEKEKGNISSIRIQRVLDDVRSLNILDQVMSQPLVEPEWRIRAQTLVQDRDNITLSDDEFDTKRAMLTNSLNSEVELEALTRLVLARPERMAELRSLPQLVWFIDWEWSQNRANGYVTMAPFLHRLMEPNSSKTPSDMQEFIAFLERSKVDHRITGHVPKSLVEYARLAVLFSPHPTIRPHSRIDLGISRTALTTPPPLPSRSGL